LSYDLLINKKKRRVLELQQKRVISEIALQKGNQTSIQSKKVVLQRIQKNIKSIDGIMTGIQLQLDTNRDKKRISSYVPPIQTEMVKLSNRNRITRAQQRITSSLLS
jgi:hypothetical protein